MFPFILRKIINLGPQSKEVTAAIFDILESDSAWNSQAFLTPVLVMVPDLPGKDDTLMCPSAGPENHCIG